MTLTLECNNLRGEWSFAAAERRAQYLLRCGRAIAPEQWCTGLIVQGQQSAQGAVLEGLI